MNGHLRVIRSLARRSTASVSLVVCVAALLGCNPTRQYDVSSGPRDTMPGVREMTLYNAPPTIEVFDFGFPGGSAGDVIVWHAPLASAMPTERNPDVVIGVCTATMIVVKSGGEPFPGEEDAREHRMTQVEFDWHGSPDSLVIMGSHPYARGAAQTDVEIVRAIVGGTGRFIGARGEIVSTPIGNGWYEHRVRLVD